MEKTTEQYLEHEVQIRVQNFKYNDLYKKHQDAYAQLNKKLNIIMGSCGAIFTTVLIPIFLHYLKMV